MIQNGWWHHHHHHHHHHHPIARHPSRRPRTRERSRSSRSASPGWSRARAAGKQRRRPFCALGLDREAMRCVSLSSSSNHLALFESIIPRHHSFGHLESLSSSLSSSFVFERTKTKKKTTTKKDDAAIIVAFVLLLLCLLLLDRRCQSLFVSGGQKSSFLSLFEKR